MFISRNLTSCRRPSPSSIISPPVCHVTTPPFLWAIDGCSQTSWKWKSQSPRGQTRQGCFCYPQAKGSPIDKTCLGPSPLTTCQLSICRVAARGRHLWVCCVMMMIARERDWGSNYFHLHLGCCAPRFGLAGPVGGDRRDGRMLGFVLTSMCDRSRVRTLTIPVKLSSAECAAWVCAATTLTASVYLRGQFGTVEVNIII